MEEDYDEDCTCKSCGWKGKESALKMDYYEQFEPMPIASLCPKCESDTN